MAATTTKKAVKAAPVEAEELTEEPTPITTAKTTRKAKAASAAPVAEKKTAKKEKPVKMGYSSAEAAEKISELTGRDITPTALRRILRSDDGGFNDEGYTRYALSDEDVARVAELISSGGAERKRGRKPKAEAEVTEAPEELDALESDDEDEEIEELDEEEDEEEEDEEEEELLDDEDEEEEV